MGCVRGKLICVVIAVKAFPTLSLPEGTVLASVPKRGHCNSVSLKHQMKSFLPSPEPLTLFHCSKR